MVQRLVSRTSFLLIGLLIVATIVRLGGIARTGFSVDEEITSLAVQGIETSGVPTLPSGVVYKRGLPYTYLAWLSGHASERDLVGFRSVSLLFGLVGVAAFFALARMLVPLPYAAASTLLLVLAPVHAAQAQWARFYSTFTAFSLVGLLLLIQSTGDRRYRPYAYGCLALAAGLHELAITLLALPAFWFFVGVADRGGQASDAASDWRADGRLLVGCLVAVGAVLWGVRGSFFAAEASILIGGSTGVSSDTYLLYPPLLLYELTSWKTWTPLVGLFAAVAWALRRALRVPWPLAAVAVVFSAFQQLGLVLLACACTVLVDPRRLRAVVSFGVAMVVAALIGWSVVVSVLVGAQWSPEFVVGLVPVTFSYPFDGVRWFARSWPLETVALGVYVALVLSPGTNRSDHRVNGGLVSVAGSTLILMGVLRDVGLRPRYFGIVLVVAFLGIGWSVFRLLGSVHSGAGEGPRTVRPATVVWTRHARRGAAGLCVLLMVGVAGSQVRRLAAPSTDSLDGPGSASTGGASVVGNGITTASLLATVDPAPWRAAVGRMDERETVVCTDEPACSYLWGRVDFWLLVSPLDRTRWARRRSPDATGWYAGARILPDLERLTSVISGAGPGHAFTVLSMRTRKYQTPDSADITAALESATPELIDVASAPGLIVWRVRR